MSKRRKQVHLTHKGKFNRAFWRRERPNGSSYPRYVHGPVYVSGRMVYMYIPGDIVDDHR